MATSMTAPIHEPKKREANNETTFKCQDPFAQGGFRPTAAQLRKMQTEVGKNNTNPDGFKTMTRNGQEYVPKFQDRPLIPFDSRGSTNRKRKLPQGEIAALRQPSVHDSTTAFESDLDGQPFKRVTRSVNKTEKPQTQTAPPSPGTRPRGGRKRKGQDRGGATQAIQPTNITTYTSQPTNLATNVTFEQTITSNTVGTPTENTLSTANETVPPSRAITSPPVDGLTSVSGSEQADITPAPMPALAPAAPGAPPALAALPQTLAEPGEVLSEAELRRRDKIANSKNPRRTIAMLDHWGKFHKDGRTRKPKRTKEQMEADRLAEETRRANGQGKAPRKRRRKTTTITVDGPATKQQRTTATATATATETATATSIATTTTTGSTTMSLQSLSIQPPATSTTIAPIVPPPPPARTMTQAYPIPLNEPPRPQSSRGFPSLHPLIPIAPPEPQPTMVSYTPRPVLPSVERNTAPPPPRWTAPSQYYAYGNPPPPSHYHPYGQPQYPPPPPNQIHQPSRRDTGLPETMQPSTSYPFDVRRPRPPLPPLQNPPRP